MHVVALLPDWSASALCQESDSRSGIFQFFNRCWTKKVIVRGGEWIYRFQYNEQQFLTSVVTVAPRKKNHHHRSSHSFLWNPDSAWSGDFPEFHQIWISAPRKKSVLGIKHGCGTAKKDVKRTYTLDGQRNLEPVSLPDYFTKINHGCQRPKTNPLWKGCPFGKV